MKRSEVYDLKQVIELLEEIESGFWLKFRYYNESYRNKLENCFDRSFDILFDLIKESEN